MWRRDLEHAKLAAGVVGKAEKLGVSDEFLSRLRDLPAQIQMTGLASTVAFLAAKQVGEKNIHKAYRATLDAMTTAVRDKVPSVGNGGLLGWLETGPTSVEQYRLATAEALAAAVWLKRVGEAHAGEGS